MFVESFMLNIYKMRVEWLCLVVHGRGLKMRIWEAVSAFLSLSLSSLELVSMVRSGCENLDVELS